MNGGVEPVVPVGPQWIRPGLRVGEGQDPLGYLSMTQDRYLPWLIPGILELSSVARYFAFHAFLLDEYRARGLPPSMAELGRFIRASEWDLGLAVERCPRGCRYSPVGARRLRALPDDLALLPRGESVQQALGGYGLYYRSPMITLGLVARAGTMLGEEPTPIDVLRPDSIRARHVVEEYRHAVGDTEYVRRFLGGDEPLPAAVVQEYAERACLCRLLDSPTEQVAVQAALFTGEPSADSEDDTLPRRRASVAHFLSLVSVTADVAVDADEFRHRLWAANAVRGAAHQAVADRWAALAVKDIWQEAMASVWADFCRRGLKQVRELGRGLAPAEVRQLAADMLDGPPAIPAELSTADLGDAIEAGTVVLTVDDETLDPSRSELEEMRAATVRLDTGSSAIVVLLELARRTRGRTGDEWDAALDVASNWQPSVHVALAGFRQRTVTGESVADTLWWLLDHFVIGTHERIAFSKLPDNTFRFRWEEGLLRFFDNGAHRFPVASVRHWPLRSLTLDLGLWENDDAPVLTPRGVAFVSEVFP